MNTAAFHTNSSSLKPDLLLTGLPDADRKITDACFEEGPLNSMFQSIAKLTGINMSDDEKIILAKEIKYKKLRRHHYFLQEGDVSKNIGFIVKGAMRMFSINEKGVDSIIELNVDNDWIMEADSYFNRVPSDYHIEAVENTELMVINEAQLYKLVTIIPALNYLITVISYCKLISARKRMDALIGMTAKDRYDKLVFSYPGYIQRFSQGIIASYLGIQPETLSRIRKPN